MLFKNLNQKFDQKNENTTQVKTSIPSEERKSIKSLKWLSCFLTLVLIITTCAVIIPILIWTNVMSNEDNMSGKCHHKYQNGICLTNSYCCDGEYIISPNLCSGNGFCCLGKVGKCKGIKALKKNLIVLNITHIILKVEIFYFYNIKN